MGPTDIVEVAKAALCEIGRPDIAEHVRPNRIGNPSVEHDVDDHEVILRAFLLAHLYVGHHATVTDWMGIGGIDCVECEAADRMDTDA